MADDLRGFKPEELAIRFCESPNSVSGSAHVGIEITHKATGIKVKSTEHKTQHQNKLNAIEALKHALVKQRFENIDEDDLTEGRDFLKCMISNSTRYWWNQ